MGDTHAGAALHQLWRRVAAEAVGTLPDRELLERFVARREEAAFAALVLRHGPMVLGVCRRLLRHEQDAEDAFQATFLVFARRAGSIHKGESLGSWLHGVARRVAGKAHAQAQRRHTHRGQESDMLPARDPLEEVARRELWEALDEELGGLPARYQAPLVHCYLEGQTQDEAAVQLGWSKSTLRRRLEQGRRLLGARLAGRGVTMPAGMGAALLAGQASAAVRGPLLETTVQAGLRWAAGATLAGVPDRVASLASGALGGLGAWRAKLAAVVLLLISAAAGLLGAGAPAPEGRPTKARAAAKEAGQAQGDNGEPARVDRDGSPLPPGALARLGTVRFRGAGRALAFSPDGQVLACGERGVGLWDAATGRELRRLEEYGLGDVRCIAFAPDGKTLAFGDMRRESPIRLWDAATGKQAGQLGGWLVDDRVLPQPPRPVGEGGLPFRGAYKPPPFEGHSGPLYAVAFSPDGKFLASSAGDVRLWDLKTRRQVRQLIGPNKKKDASLLAFAPDGKTLAVVLQAEPGAYEDKLLSFWDVASGKERRRFRGHDQYIGCIAFSPDGQLLASGSSDKTVRLWDVATGRRIRELRGHESGLQGVVSIAFSPDGKTLAAAGMTTLHLWDPSTGKELRRIDEKVGPLLAVAFSPDGKTLVSTGGNGRIRLRDPLTGRERFPNDGHESWTVAVGLSPDGRTVVSGGADRTIRVWETFSGRPLRQLEKAQYQGAGMVCTPDGKTVIASSYQYPKGYTVGLWDVATGKALRQFGGHADKVWRVALSGDGRTLATSGGESLCLWDVGTGELRHRVKGHRGGAYAVTLSPDGKLLAALDGEGTAHLWDATTGAHRHAWRRPKGDPTLRSVAFSPDGALLAAGSDEGVIALWRVTTGKEVARWTGHPKYPRGVTSLAFTPDGRVLVSGGDDHTVRLWEVATGQERRCFRGHQLGVTSVACSTDGRVVVSSSFDETLLVWDVTGRLHEGRLRAARPSPRQLPVLWRDLADEDAARAHTAIWTLTAAGADTVPFLRQRLQPWRVDLKGIEGLIGQLDDKQFAVRQQATLELEQLGALARPALRRALEAKPSLEVRRRLEDLLQRLAKVAPQQTRRALRAVEVLEYLGTRPARHLLHELAREALEPGLRLEAEGALRRLTGPARR
jgi:RNA polymerase sigma factor (sigma-70 family)